MTKALSLLQPWATLAVTGQKRIETRNWTTQYRGRLLIHASKGRSGALVAGEAPVARLIPDFAALPFGAIIGEVTLTEIVLLNEQFLPPAELERLTLEAQAFGSYETRRYAWLFDEAIVYEEPIPATGALGLWDAG